MKSSLLRDEKYFLLSQRRQTTKYKKFFYSYLFAFFMRIHLFKIYSSAFIWELSSQRHFIMLQMKFISKIEIFFLFLLSFLEAMSEIKISLFSRKTTNFRWKIFRNEFLLCAFICSWRMDEKSFSLRLKNKRQIRKKGNWKLLAKFSILLNMYVLRVFCRTFWIVFFQHKKRYTRKYLSSVQYT